MRFEALSQRGGIFVWRQGSGDPPSPSTGTMAPRPKWQFRARGTRTFVWRTPSAASVDIIIPGVVGNAVAAGVTGAVTQDTTIAATVGNAAAAGVTGEATVGSDISIDGIVGNAVAAGVTGSASVSGVEEPTEETQTTSTSSPYPVGALLNSVRERDPREVRRLMRKTNDEAEVLSMIWALFDQGAFDEETASQ